MKRVADLYLERRSAALYRRLEPHLPQAGALLDVGSGTGHNARMIRRHSGLFCAEADVEDLSLGPEKPILFDGRRLPFRDGEFEVSTLLFVLHYVEDPAALLAEVRRVTSRRLLILQSTYEGRPAKLGLTIRDFFEGRFVFSVARALGWVSASRCTLFPFRFYTPASLRQSVSAVGFREVAHENEGWRRLSRDLFVFDAAPRQKELR